MKNYILKMKTILILAIYAMLVVTTFYYATAEPEAEGDLPKPIFMTQPKEPLEDRLARKITLDVRDMNVVDVVKFLAQKGEFNVIVSPAVDGRTTVYLHEVGIKDALDIVVLTNRLGYRIENDIIQIMPQAEYESLYGKAFGEKTEVAIIHLQYSKPSYVLAALDNIKSNIGKIIIDEDTGSVVLIDTAEAITKMKDAIKDIEQPLDTVAFNLQYAKAEVVAEKLRARIDAKSVGTITADERTNQLIVRVFPARRHEVEKIIKGLDTPTKEVLIEARILQIVMKPTYDLGMDWNIASKSGGSGAGLTEGIQFNNILSNDNLSSTYGRVAIGDFTMDQFQASLKFLEGVSDTKILSNPQILVTNNEEAKIHIGDTVPYIVTTTNGTGDNAIISEDVRFVDVGLKLNVIPVINDEGMVTLKVQPEISSVVGTIDSQNQGGIPQVNKTEVQTTLMVKDGQTVVMAGLRKDDKSHNKKGLPILMHMPFVDKFFSRTADSITSTEIVILITPHIVTGEDDYRKPDGTIKPSKNYSDVASITSNN